MTTRPRAHLPPGDQPPDPAVVAVRIRLRGGHCYELALSTDSELLRELVQQPSAPGRPTHLIEIPLEGGRAVATFRADEMVAVETTPPFRPSAAADWLDQRSVADLDGPPIRFTTVSRITNETSYASAHEMAQRHLDAFEHRRDDRRTKLRQICDEMDCATFTVTAFNAGFIPMLRNWVASCDAHAVDARRRTVLFPMDDAADRVGRDLGFATCYDPQSYGRQSRDAVASYGGPGFADCVFLKLAMAQDMLQLGYDFLLQDIDMVWFADPVPELRSRAIAERLDFQFMRDLNSRFQPLYYNSGFIYMHNNPLTRHTWQTIFSAYPAVVFHRSDQTVVNQVVSCFKERGLRTERLPDRYVDGQILAQVDVGKRPLPPDRVVAHVNWTENLTHKIQRLRNLDLWYLD